MRSNNFVSVRNFHLLGVSLRKSKHFTYKVFLRALYIVHFNVLKHIIVKL